MITTVDEYAGQPAVRVEATQLEGRFSARQASRIVEEWCDFLSAGPTAILDLSFVSRTPKRLFAALRGQTQLRTLRVKWGDYDDLSPLTALRDLTGLRLGGASSVTSLAPLAELPQLRGLAVESLRRAHDLSPLAALTELRSLELGGDWTSPRNAHVDSIAPLGRLTHLELLELHTIIVDDLDYSPLLALTRLQRARVKAVRGMRPTYDELCAALPAIERPPVR